MSDTHTAPATPAEDTLSRRGFIFDTLGMALSATAVALLSGYPRLARAVNGDDSRSADDVRILGTDRKSVV